MPASGKFAITRLELEFVIIDVFDCSADIFVNFAIQFGTHYSGGSKISPRRGRQLSRDGRQHMILPNFPKNCMKLKEFGPPGGGGGGARPKFYYEDPPLHYHFIWDTLLF